MLRAPKDEACEHQALPGSKSFGEFSVCGEALCCLGGLGSFGFIFHVLLRDNRVSLSCAYPSSYVALVLDDQLDIRFSF